MSEEEDREEVIGTVEGYENPYSRENKSLWFASSHSRQRYLCTKCQRGQHSPGYDNPCNADCECLCKTHYIARDGFTKIPYGKPDHTRAVEDDLPPPSDQFLEINESWLERKRGE